MQTLTVVQTDTFLDRRNYTPEQSDLWERLSLSQKFSTSSLNQFGYNLAFIRNVDKSNIAILLCGVSVATISTEGDINTEPNITIR
ncbi:MAG: hypothetical protein MJK12_17280 [Colwellia sp.]|nr:hypothetical protein [Colwellia sp.]